MKKCLMTGLVILLPLALTLWIIVTVVNWLTNPFLGAMHRFISAIGMDTFSVSFLRSDQAQLILGKVLVLLFLFFFIAMVGAIGRYVFVRSLIRFGDAIVHKIPLISSVYHTVQELLRTVLSSEKRAFKQVVLVPFPHAGCWSVGLLTREESSSTGTVPVFVPTTPNPTSGYLIMFQRSDIVPLSMSVEEAFRYVVSCGVLLPEGGMKVSTESPSGGTE